MLEYGEAAFIQRVSHGAECTAAHAQRVEAAHRLAVVGWFLLIRPLLAATGAAGALEDDHLEAIRFGGPHR